MGSLLARAHWRSWVAGVLVLFAIATTWVQGLRVGADQVFPGPMNRHRDAVAIALTLTAYGEWHGYASFRKVVRVLNDNGLSIHPEDVTHTGMKDYFEVMRSPAVVNAAIAKAASLSEPGSEGLYFLNDEKGSAVFYILAFWLFGTTVASFFYTYALLFTLSALAFLTSFFRRAEMLLLLLAVLFAHAVLVVACQDLQPDVNAIHSGRFLPLLSLIAVLHLVFLLVLQVRPTPWQVAGAIFQTALFLFVLNARGSALWQAMLMLAFCGWWFLKASMPFIRGRMRAAEKRQRPTLWPAAVVIVGLLAHQVVVRVEYHPRFLSAKGTVNHVIWHSLTTALHNNPARTEVFGIDGGVPVWDDAVAYSLFKREISRRGETLAQYLIGDGDWRLRTSDPTFDYVWSRYDGIMRDQFLKAVSSHPFYALKSFTVYQTRDTIKAVYSVVRDNFPAIVQPAALFILFVGALVLGRTLEAVPVVWGVLAIAAPLAALPTYASAVVPLRITDLLFVMLSMLYFAFAQGTARLLIPVMKVGHGSADMPRLPGLRRSVD